MKKKQPASRPNQKQQQQPPPPQTEQPFNAEVVFIMDMSGSMAITTQATISETNQYLDRVKEKTPQSRLWFTTFNTVGIDEKRNINLVYEGAPLDTVEPRTAENYVPSGATPLFDAIGITLRTVETKIPADRPVFVAILTDGYENCSVEFSLASINKIITEYQEKGWTFIYLGPQATASGRKLGIPVDNVIDYQPSNPAANYGSAWEATSRYFDSGGQQRRGLMKKD